MGSRSITSCRCLKASPSKPGCCQHSRYPIQLWPAGAGLHLQRDPGVPPAHAGGLPGRQPAAALVHVPQRSGQLQAAVRPPGELSGGRQRPQRPARAAGPAAAEESGPGHQPAAGAGEGVPERGPDVHAPAAPEPPPCSRLHPGGITCFRGPDMGCQPAGHCGQHGLRGPEHVCWGERVPGRRPPPRHGQRHPRSPHAAAAAVPWVPSPHAAPAPAAPAPASVTALQQLPVGSTGPLSPEPAFPVLLPGNVRPEEATASAVSVLAALLAAQCPVLAALARLQTPEQIAWAFFLGDGCSNLGLSVYSARRASAASA